MYFRTMTYCTSCVCLTGNTYELIHDDTFTTTSNVGNVGLLTWIVMDVLGEFDTMQVKPLEEL